MPAPLIYGAEITERPCTKCGEVKPVSMFSLKGRSAYSIYSSACLQCRALAKRERMARRRGGPPRTDHGGAPRKYP